jgi:glycosyltransferase involved in cell wall biosynthesis
MEVNSNGMQIVIAMPVYEDWESAFKLTANIDSVLRKDSELRAKVFLIDDGSTTNACPIEYRPKPEVLSDVSVLKLRRNLGHQRAIAVALAYLHTHHGGDALVIMDADGEDRPEDIPGMLELMKASGRPIAVFAERGKRLETPTFRLFYRLYTVLHLMLTGRTIRFGNFSILPWTYLDRLVAYPELWNHYAATVLKSRLPYTSVRCNRGTRIAGRSRMDFTSLVVHGLSALFADQEVVGTRLLMATIGLTTMLVLLIGLVVGVKLLTSLAIPGWATFTLGLLLILVGQSAFALFMVVFSVIMNRSQLGFLPVRDYQYFVQSETSLYSKP